MILSMVFAPAAPWRSDQRVAACFALSLTAHLVAVFAAVPPLFVQPRAILPALDVRVVELPAAAPRTVSEEPVTPPQEVQSEAKDEPVPRPDRERAADGAEQVLLTKTAPAESPITEKPPAAQSEPPLAAEPALTESERAKLNSHYLADSAVDRKAVSLDEVRQPEYPPEALEQGITGCVLVMVYIGASGAVENIDVIRSDPPEIFDRNAMRSFVHKRYLPAIKGNAPVRSRVPGVASFEIEGKPQPYCALRYFPLVQELNGQPITLGQDAK